LQCHYDASQSILGSLRAARHRQAADRTDENRLVYWWFESVARVRLQPKWTTLLVAEAAAVIAEAAVVVPEAAVVVAEAAAVVAEAPDVVAEAPAVVAEAPDVVAEAPAVVAEAPVVVAEAAAVVAEAAVVVAHRPLAASPCQPFEARSSTGRDGQHHYPEKLVNGALPSSVAAVKARHL
jgi:hypothetical protein